MRIRFSSILVFLGKQRNSGHAVCAVFSMHMSVKQPLGIPFDDTCATSDCTLPLTTLSTSAHNVTTLHLILTYIEGILTTEELVVNSIFALRLKLSQRIFFPSPNTRCHTLFRWTCSLTRFPCHMTASWIKTHNNVRKAPLKKVLCIYLHCGCGIVCEICVCSKCFSPG